MQLRLGVKKLFSDEINLLFGLTGVCSKFVDFVFAMQFCPVAFLKLICLAWRVWLKRIFIETYEIFGRLRVFQ